MYGSARKAYETGATATTSNREIEATALFKAARQLEACRETWEQPGHEERLEHALRYNQRLWTLFQAELARPDHPMVPALRRDLLQISVFVDKRTFEILGAPTPDKLQALIDIDRNIASGLAVRAAA
jgi:flagellar biosynthesis activator protein FlaF